METGVTEETCVCYWTACVCWQGDGQVQHLGRIRWSPGHRRLLSLRAEDTLRLTETDPVESTAGNRQHS